MMRRNCERANVLRLASATLLLSTLVACSDEVPQTSFLLITVDTLRADALGSYGASPSVTPNLDRLASRSTVFENASAPMPMTRPSHFSLFTSLYPREHGVMNNHIKLPDERLTLAEILAEAGYRTGAFVAVGLLSEESGAGQGFEVIRAPRRQRPANEVVDEALAWVESLDENEPFFLWVHVFDPHQPYEQIEPELGDVDPEMMKKLPSIAWADLYALADEHEGDIPQEVLDHARDLYRAEVAWVDQQLGRLLEGIASVRNLDDTFTVLTADHGECFEDGVFFDHSDCLLDGALRIPLMVRHPASFVAGKRVATQVSSVDVAPTILEAAGLPLPDEFSGSSLRSLTRESDRFVLVQHPFYQSKRVEGLLTKRRAIKSVGGVPSSEIIVDVEKVGVVGPGWKFIRSGGDEELYRMSPERDETRNLASSQRDQAERLGRELDRLLEQHPLEIIEKHEINDELRSTLEALGYIQ